MGRCHSSFATDRIHAHRAMGLCRDRPESGVRLSGVRASRHDRRCPGQSFSPASFRLTPANIKARREVRLVQFELGLWRSRAGAGTASAQSRAQAADRRAEHDASVHRRWADKHLVFGSAYLVTRPHDVAALDHSSEGRVVVRACSYLGANPGNTSSTRAPRPFAGSAATARPPCASAIARTIASPSPAPPVERLRPASVR